MTGVYSNYYCFLYFQCIYLVKRAKNPLCLGSSYTLAGAGLAPPNQPRDSYLCPANNFDVNFDVNFTYYVELCS